MEYRYCMSWLSLYSVSLDFHDVISNEFSRLISHVRIQPITRQYAFNPINYSVVLLDLRGLVEKIRSNYYRKWQSLL